MCTRFGWLGRQVVNEVASCGFLRAGDFPTTIPAVIPFVAGCPIKTQYFGTALSIPPSVMTKNGVFIVGYSWKWRRRARYEAIRSVCSVSSKRKKAAWITSFSWTRAVPARALPL